MLYRGRHRRGPSRGKVRLAALAVSLISSTLAAPIAPITAHAAAETDHAWPAWLQGNDITINPTGPPAGQSEAPPVEVGCAITGDALTRYDITTTAAAQYEVRAFVARINERYGLRADPAEFSVYGLPSITRVEYAAAAKHFAAAVTALDDVAQGEIERAGDHLAYVLSTVDGLGAYVGAEYSLDLDGLVARVEAVLDQIPAPGTVDPQPFVDQVAALAAGLQPTADALLYSLGMPGTGEVIEDPTVVAPIGAGDVEALAVEDDLGLGSVLVLPTGALVELVAAAWRDGQLMVSTVARTSPVPAYGGVLVQPPDPMGGDKWQPAGGLRCMERKQNNTAWYDPCSWWYEHTDDGNRNRLTWGLVQYGTGKSKGVWKLKELEVQSWRKTGTPDQDWIKWSPDSDMEGGHCSTVTVGVNVKAAYLEVPKSWCDTWDIHKGEQPADFANRWRSTWGAGRTERSTAMVIATDIPNGTVPHDLVSFDYYAR